MMELYKGNCINVMQELVDADRHFDCCITSPPYNMNLRVRDGKYISRLKYDGNTQRESFSSKYDEYRDDLSVDDYFSLLDSFLDKALMLCNIVFMNIQPLTGNKVSLFRLLGKYADKVKDIIIWDKTKSQPAMHDAVLNSEFEFIIIFDSKKAYNRAFDICNFERGTESNIWRIPAGQHKLNKAAFPEELVIRILNNFTNENQTILDPFMGSGTTGVVCTNMNRHFVGIELCESMFNAAQNRIIATEKAHRTKLF